MDLPKKQSYNSVCDLQHEINTGQECLGDLAIRYFHSMNNGDGILAVIQHIILSLEL